VYFRFILLIGLSYPYSLKAALEHRLDAKIEKLITDSQNGFSHLVKLAEITEDVVNATRFTEANGRKYNCAISPHKYLKQIKGILYVYEYEFNEQFKKDLVEEPPSLMMSPTLTSWNLETNKLQHSH